MGLLLDWPKRGFGQMWLSFWFPFKTRRNWRLGEGFRPFFEDVWEGETSNSQVPRACWSSPQCPIPFGFLAKKVPPTLGLPRLCLFHRLLLVVKASSMVSGKADASICVVVLCSTPFVLTSGNVRESSSLECTRHFQQTEQRNGQDHSSVFRLTRLSMTKLYKPSSDRMLLNSRNARC